VVGTITEVLGEVPGKLGGHGAPCLLVNDNAQLAISARQSHGETSTFFAGFRHERPDVIVNARFQAEGTENARHKRIKLTSWRASVPVDCP
jgi:hypothetical protein